MLDVALLHVCGFSVEFLVSVVSAELHISPYESLLPIILCVLSWLVFSSC